MTDDPKDPKKPQEIPPGETPDSLPDIPERPIEEPGPDVVPEEALTSRPSRARKSRPRWAIRYHAGATEISLS
jgi:hypothetical protein